MCTVHKKTLFASLLAIILWPASAWSLQFHVVDQNGASVANAVVSVPAATAPDAAHKLAIMDQREKQFDPYVLAVSQGQKVKFPNSDNIRHHVYSFSSAKPFEIRLYKGVPGNPLLFDTPGVVVLGCNIHDKMVGYIYVSKSPVFGVTSSDGGLALDLKARPATVEIWHPDAKNPQQPVTVAIPAGDTNSVVLSIDITTAKLAAANRR